MNIGDIAKLAGVSSAAVSRYFNNGYISEEKREAISKVVEETGFRPSRQAQMLRTKKTRLVGVIIPRIDSASVSRMVRGVLSVLNETGYHLVLSDSQNNEGKEADYLSFYAARQVDGIIFVATVLGQEQRELLADLGVPVVILGQNLPGFCCVYQPDREATRALTSHVLAGGSRRPCYIGALPEDEAVGQSREGGFLDALSQAGLTPFPDGREVAGFSIESGYEKAALLYQRHPDLDAFICATDDMAVGALTFLKEKGIDVPGTVQVAGHGNTKMAQVITPSLTSVRFDYEESGAIAARQLLDILERDGDKVDGVCMGFALETRQSTKET